MRWRIVLMALLGSTLVLASGSTASANETNADGFSCRVDGHRISWADVDADNDTYWVKLIRNGEKSDLVNAKGSTSYLHRNQEPGDAYRINYKVDDRRRGLVTCAVGYGTAACGNPSRSDTAYQRLKPNMSQERLTELLESDAELFFLEPGVYRLTAELPLRSGQLLRGAVQLNNRGRCINQSTFVGSVPVTWQSSNPDSRVVSTAPLARGSYQNGNTPLCDVVANASSEEKTRCRRPNDLFFKEGNEWTPMTRVLTAGEVTSGHWFQRSDNRIVIAAEDRTRQFEYSVVPNAFAWRDVSNVAIDHIRFVRFASQLQFGAIAGGPQQEVDAWAITNSYVSDSHGSAARIGTGSLFQNNLVEGTGGIALGARGGNIVIRGNELRNSGYSGVKPGWEGGGLKFSGNRDLRTTEPSLIEANCVHHNKGSGLWADVYADGVIFDGNVVYENEGMGIFYEVSRRGEIRNNTVGGNAATSGSKWLWGGQIALANSSETVVHYNDVEVNGELRDDEENFWANGIVITHQPWRVLDPSQYPDATSTGNEVTNNTVSYLESSRDHVSGFSISGERANPLPGEADQVLADRENYSDEYRLRPKELGFHDNDYYVAAQSDDVKFMETQEVETAPGETEFRHLRLTLDQLRDRGSRSELGSTVEVETRPPIRWSCTPHRPGE